MGILHTIQAVSAISADNVDFILYTIPTLIVLYYLVNTIRHLYFHPLRNIPGPRLARATHLYYYYYNIIHDGILSQRLPHLHEYYKSSIIRIAPNHVHINDVDVYRQAYTNKTKFMKWDFFYQSSEKVDSIVTVTDPHRHQIYRNLLGPLFSMRTIDQSSKMIIGQFIQAGDSMVKISQKGKVVDTGAIFKAFAANINGLFLLGMSDKLVDYDNAENDLLLTSLDTVTTNIQLFTCFPSLATIGHHFIEQIGPYTIPGMIKLKEKCIKSIRRSVDNKKTETNSRSSLFDVLLDLYPEEALNPEKNSDKLFDHAMAMIFAGIESVGYTFSAAIFYLIKHPDVLGKLREELGQCSVQMNEQTFDSNFDWHILLQLPYLSAIVKETLRTFPVAPGPLPRVVPAEGLSVGPHFLPGGTIISATINGFHKNPSIFPNPEQFDPSRWLTKSEAQEKALTPFSRGSRSCIGMTLATRELYTGIAYLFSRFDMELVGEYPDTMDFSDHGVAKPHRPVMVRVTERQAWSS